MNQPPILKNAENRIDKMNEYLLESVKNVLEKGQNPASVLQNILNMGKDAVYRRLRGEVSFTLDEVSVICSELGICLDPIICGFEAKKVLFDVECALPKGKENGGAFMQMLQAHTKIWETDGGKFTAACPSLPEFIILRFPKFSRFRLYVEYTRFNIPYSEFTVPESLKKIQAAYNNAFSSIHSLELIFDDNLLSPFIKEINYLKKLGMLSGEEADELYEELLLIVDVIEAATLSGNFPDAKNTTGIYLAHAGIGTEIWLFENNSNNLDNSTVWLSLYPGKNIRTQNKGICENHKKRIDEIKRFSTFITRSGEVARREFFTGLRKQLTSDK